MVPEWIQRMRDMAAKHLTPEVVETIVKNQIEAAKKGDRNAIRFKGATFVQNNYGAEFGEQNARPTDAKPGSQEKLDQMRRRVANGQSVAQPGDGKVPAWECAGCGHVTETKPAKCPKCQTFTFKPLD
jgi:rubrerythrin